MGFLSGGATNNFTPAGQSNNLAQTNTANTNYAQANNGLNTLAAQLQQQATGGGPNLANQQLANATGQNVSNQAALMAGQRGASSNVGLIARQAAQQGAGIQQQAAGQAATNRLQQQIQAQQNLGGVLGTQGSLANNNYQVAQGAVNNDNNIGSDISQANTKAQQGALGGLGNVIGTLAGTALGGPLGGALVNQIAGPAKHAAGGNIVGEDVKNANNNIAQNTPMPSFGPGSDFGLRFINMQPPKSNMAPLNAGMPAAAQSVLGANPQQIQDPTQQNMAKGGNIMPKGGNTLPFQPMDYRRGGPVQANSPQQKATVPGNSYANDKIPGMLSEGEIVIPREITQGANAPMMAAKFVHETLSKKKAGR